MHITPAPELPTPHTPAWYDLMYNNRALVPDFADHFTRWQQDSEAARESQRCVRDVAYGTSSLENLDIFPCALQPQAPVFVFIHGGYWRSLDKSDHSFVAPSLHRLGACVVIPNYDLCPKVTIPEIALQMVKCLGWVYKNIKHWGGDPDQIHLIGHSAGGHLVAMLMACDWHSFDNELPADLVKNALSISGLFDLRPLTQTPFLSESLRLTPADALRSSPALMPAPKRGKLISVAGAKESEEFIRQNHLIQESWGVHRVPVCEDLAGLNHFSVLQGLVDTNHRLFELAKSLLD